MIYTDDENVDKYRFSVSDLSRGQSQLVDNMYCWQHPDILIRDAFLGGSYPLTLIFTAKHHIMNSKYCRLG